MHINLQHISDAGSGSFFVRTPERLRFTIPAATTDACLTASKTRHSEIIDQTLVDRLLQEITKPAPAEPRVPFSLKGFHS